MGRIQSTPPEKAEGRLKDAYENVAYANGHVHQVHRLTSLDPDFMEAHNALWKAAMFGKGGLRRRDRELIATAASRANGCRYCVPHHRGAFAKYEKDENLVDAVATDPENAPLGERDRALVDYALLVTRTPSDVDDAAVARLRDAGLDDRQILSANTVLAYINLVNRLAITLGADHEEDMRDLSERGAA